MTKISAQIVADSITKQGDRITSYVLTFPRIILAELNTHRMFTRNSASSRAIPFKKMVQSVIEDPFIPIAWQKDHSGMQGTEYIDNDYLVQTIWLKARDSAIKYATELNLCSVTKQLCNRLMEAFMYHTVILTATEYYNFFDLRSSQYEVQTVNNDHEVIKSDYYKSKKDFAKAHPEIIDTYDYLGQNKGMAEIHMMALAEAMWDARNESIPEKLLPGEWHIPFKKHITLPTHLKKWEGKMSNFLTEITESMVKISTAMCARVSFTTVGDEKEFTPDNQIALHDRLINQRPLHASPMEHCNRCMNDEEYETNIRGKVQMDNKGIYVIDNSVKGWCRNMKGWIQYRELIENNQTI